MIAIVRHCKTAQIHCFTVLDQVLVLDFQLGPDLKDENFLGFYILDWETLTAICFSEISSSRLYQLKKFMGTLDQTDLQTITE